MDLGIYNKRESRNKIVKIQKSKNKGLGIWNWFGTNLTIPNIRLFEHLDQKMNYGHHTLCACCDLFSHQNFHTTKTKPQISKDLELI